MNTTKVFATVGVIAAAAVAIVYARKIILNYQAVNTSGTTSTSTAGPTGSTVTTPVQTNNAAYVAPKSTLSLLVDSGRQTVSNIASLIFPARTDVRQPFGNSASASAANASPSAPDTVPSGYAVIK